MGIKIDITPKDLKTLQTLLKQYLPNTVVWAFGSRVKFTAKPSSDLDLVAFITNEQEMTFSLLKDAISESYLPFRVDLHNWYELPENFHKNIENSYVEIQSETKSEMPNNWKKYRLGDFAEINPRVSLKQGNEYSFVEMKDLDAMLKYVSPSAKKELKGGSKFENGDTLFARITPCLENGKICQVKNLENNLGFGSTEFLVFRGKKDISDTDFVYYLTKTDYVKNNAIQMMTGSSGRQRVEKSALENLEIFAPDLATQTQIAQILTTFDDKIELLEQMNKTLETIAQTIFKEWFVNFNFPGFDGELVEGLPKGWRKGKLGDVVEFMNGYAFKSNELLDNYSEDCYHIFKMGHIKKGGGLNIDGTKSYYKKNDATKLSKYILQKGDLLMCMTDMKGNVALLGHTALMNESNKYIVNQRVGLLRVSNSLNIDYPYLFILTNYPEFITEIRSRANSGVQVNLSTGEIKNTEIVIPSKDINKEYDSIAKHIFEKIFSNIEQIRTLTHLRDTLLPKLISGQCLKL